MRHHRGTPYTADDHRAHVRHHVLRENLRRLPFALMGLSALLWVLVRVIPKPSRASYPCMRASMPIAAGFVVWLAGLFGSGLLVARGKALFRERRRAAAVICVLLGLAAGAAYFLAQPASRALAEPQAPNDPIGAAAGIHPGRVVWIHDASATDWLGPGYGHWWEPEHTDYAVVDEMVSLALRRLSGQYLESVSWDALFRHFNATHGRGNVGYSPGEKIMIKVNYVGCHANTGGVDPVSYNLTSLVDYPNTSPQVILAMLRQLVNVVGVAEEDISVGDPQARFPNDFYDVFHGEFPDVHYVDRYGGTAEHPRTAVQYSTVPFYWSCRPAGKTQDYVPQCYADAAYLISIGNLKAHRGAGMTLCAKNHYGSLIRIPTQSGYYDMHTSLPYITSTSGSYRAIVDLMGHAHIGGKTMLLLVDGLYEGTHGGFNIPHKWNCEPFNGDWTSSVFASQDPVAIESMCLDLMQLDSDPNGYPRMAGADDYLHEAALAGGPPSGTFYDPDHPTGTARLQSLGVHEHWNNSTDREYSRNLGTGDGIELVVIDPVTGIEAGTPGPALATCVYPNPFNPLARIRFELPRASRVEVDVFSTGGEHVVRLLAAALPEGPHEVVWKGTNAAGQRVASGVYFYRILAGPNRATGRMVLLR